MRWLSIGKNILKMIVLLGMIAEKMIMPELNRNSFYENKSYSIGYICFCCVCWFNYGL
ncbi:hypothetical protein ECABU_c48690 [Escherichia coli ABU 83972]|nr:hypothetical protein ECABU_c48690 [Escherichia coli ABU 83972]